MPQVEDASDESQPQSQYANCPACNQLGPTPAAFTRPKRLTDAVEVRTWPELVAATEWKHAVDVGHLLAYYKVPDFLKCSLGHENKEGSIVRTRCGLVILLGRECALKAISGYEELSQHWTEAEARYNRIDRIRRIPFESIDKLDEYLPELRKASQFRDAKLPTAFGQEMLRRAASHSPKAAEITIKVRVFESTKATDLGNLDVVEEDAVQLVQGLAFWNKDLAIERAERLLDEAKELFAIAKSTDWDQAPDEETFALNQRCSSLENGTRHVREVRDLCRSFLTDANLHRAHVAIAQRFAG